MVSSAFYDQQVRVWQSRICLYVLRKPLTGNRLLVFSVVQTRRETWDGVQRRRNCEMKRKSVKSYRSDFTLDLQFFEPALSILQGRHLKTPLCLQFCPSVMMLSRKQRDRIGRTKCGRRRTIKGLGIENVPSFLYNCIPLAQEALLKPLNNASVNNKLEFSFPISPCFTLLSSSRPFICF